MAKSGGKDTTAVKKWVSYFDALRVLAAFAVVVLHVAARRWGTQEVGTDKWLASNFWDGLMRWAVPIFIMISGALMLNPDKTNFSIKRLYSKNILRLVTAFAFWSLIYVLFSVLICNQYEGIGKALKDLFLGHYHMWFVYMLIGLYVVTPVLRLITKDRKMTEYFLIVGIVISIALPGIQMLCKGYAAATGSHLADYIAGVIGDFNGLIRFKFAAGYVLYYVLGYWLFSNKTSKRMRIVYYVLGIIGLILTFYFGQKVSMVKGETLGDF